MKEQDLQHSKNAEIPISDPWVSFTKAYPISLLEAVLWMTGLFLAQQGAKWLVDAEYVALPEGAPELTPHAVLFVLGTIALLAYWKLIRKASLRSLGVGSEGWTSELLFAAKMLLVGAIVYLVAGTIFWLGLHLFVDDATTGFKEHLRKAVFRDESAGRIFAVVILYPVLEELWYRGLLYTPMRQQMGRAAAIILVSLLFAFAHGWVPVNQFIGGLLFVWAYEKRRSLFVPIVLHIVGNGILVVFGWALKNWPEFAAWFE